MGKQPTEPVTLLSLRAVNNLSIEEIAEIAGVSPEDVYYIEAGVAYPQQVIEQVLIALSKLLGAQYTIDTVGGVHIAKGEGWENTETEKS
jgi:transcriptional regulator with XRE-family HTH domain